MHDFGVDRDGFVKRYVFDKVVEKERTEDAGLMNCFDVKLRGRQDVDGTRAETTRTDRSILSGEYDDAMCDV